MSLSMSSIDHEELGEISISYNAQARDDSFCTRDRDSVFTENPLMSNDNSMASDPSLSSAQDRAPQLTRQRIQSMQSVTSDFAFPGVATFPSQQVDFTALEDDALISFVQRQLSTDRPAAA